MYEPKVYEMIPENFHAGTMPIGKEGLNVKDGETIEAKSLVKLSDGEAAAYTADDATAGTIPYGIAAADAENGCVVVYLSGEFRGDALKLPEGVEVDTVKPLLRENGIFLK